MKAFRFIQNQCFPTFAIKAFQLATLSNEIDLCHFIALFSNSFSFFQLYEALHVGEHQVLKERELHEKLEELNVKLGPLEKVTHANCLGQTNKADYIAGFMC